jgi:23S rRNA (adenine2503-C2)-methyltransferase
MPESSDTLPSPPTHAATALTGLLPDELAAALSAAGEKPYRAKQIQEWVFQKRALNYAEMTNLPALLRESLAATHPFHSLRTAKIQGAKDTTRKFLFRLHDGRYVESVLIPANKGFMGNQSDRLTLCVSSQVGCAYDCKFCASGLAGFTRNLRADEIVEQVMAAEREAGERIDNIVFMGMGEPLANFTHLTRALQILQGHWGLNIGARHITVSTSGLAPQIKKLADFPLKVRLAISLHGATDEVRSKIMPVNNKYPLEELFEALRYFRQRSKHKITMEYILIEGINDGMDQAKALARRVRSLEAKVNLIPYNTVEGLPWVRPSEAQQDAFCATLVANGVPATIRREKGHDIDAACGQLRLKQESAEGLVEASLKAVS